MKERLTVGGIVCSLLVGCACDKPHEESPSSDSVNAPATVLEPPSVTAALNAQRLRDRIDRPLSIKLKEWARGLLAEPFDAPSDVPVAVDVIPDFVLRLGGGAQNPLVVVRREWSDIGPSVMVTWGWGSQEMWGLLLGADTLKVASAFYKCERIEDGCFSFYVDLLPPDGSEK